MYICQLVGGQVGASLSHWPRGAVTNDFPNVRLLAQREVAKSDRQCNSRRRDQVIDQPLGQTIELTCSSTIVMHYLRKSMPLANTPSPTPASPAELVENLMSQRNSKALSATSSAIALSIGSAFSDARGMSTNGAAPQGMDAIQRTAYAAVRMAVEITKESSDLCLPLKAVVGAMSALMKNYDVSVLVAN